MLIKNLIYTFCKAPKLPQYQGIKFISKGSAKDYNIIKQLGHSLKSEKLFLYSREPIDVGMQMIKSNTKLITYITDEHYETVLAEKINPTSKQCTKQQDSMQENLKCFLNQHKFKIRASFLDLHPFQAYHKMYSFLGAQKNVQQTKIFRKCNFSLQQLKQNTSILSYLKKLHDKYLQTNQLKLRKLDRIAKATPGQIQESLAIWRNLYLINGIYQTKREQQNFKKQFALKNNMGEFVEVQQLLQGYGQRYYYASWENN